MVYLHKTTKWGIFLDYLISSENKLNNNKAPDFSKIKFVNLHAHSENSLRDGVGAVREHYIETISKGHCACCLTDHGHYLSAFELVMAKDSAKKDKGISGALEASGKKEQPIIAGCELYIYDDTESLVLNALMANSSPLVKIRDFLVEKSTNPRFTTLFDQIAETETLDNEVAVEVKTDKEKRGTMTISLLNKLIETTPDLKFDDISNPKDKMKILELVDGFKKCFSNKYNHITVIAKNEEGHENINYLVSLSSVPQNYYTKPRVALSDLLANKGGLIVTSGCYIGMIPQAIAKKTGEEERLVELFLKEFGDDFYIEIHLADIRWNWNGKLQEFVKTSEENPQEIVNIRLLELAKKYNLLGNTYITQDSHMPKKEDKIKQDSLLKSQSDNKSGWHFKDTYSIMTVEEMWEKCVLNAPYIDADLFAMFCNNTIKVLEKCKNFTIDKSIKLDEFKFFEHNLGLDYYDQYLKNHTSVVASHKYIQELAPEVYSSPDRKRTQEDIEFWTKEILRVDKEILDLFEKHKDEYFVRLVSRDFKKDLILTVIIRSCFHKKKIDFSDHTYRRQFFKELSVIQLNGANPLLPYFSTFEEIVYIVLAGDGVKGAGRGSASGSILNYALDITDVDPILNELSFERFQTRERIYMYYIFEDEADFEKFSLENKNIYDEFPVEFIESTEYLKSTFETSKDEKLREFANSKEFSYIYRTPEMAEYLVRKLKEGNVSKTNKNNSVALYILGLASEPTGPVTTKKGSMPDIDFDTSNREKVINGLIQKRGLEKVVLVGAYLSLAVKSAIKLILSISKDNTGMPFTPERQNFISSLVDRVKFDEDELKEAEDEGKDIVEFKLQKLMDNLPEFRKFMTDNEHLREAIVEIMGHKQGQSIHAGGVLLSSRSLLRQMPCVWSDKKQCFASMLDKNHCEYFGFQKLDILGLTQLEIIENAYRLIREDTGKDYFKISMDKIVRQQDPKVLEIAKLDPSLIFQIGSSLLSSYLKSLPKVDVYQIIALVQALIRPGPMASKVHDKIREIMWGYRDVRYDIPQLEPILKKTSGEIVYQEQIMKIGVVIGGLTLFESDDFRRAMGKKDVNYLKKYKDKLINNAIKNHGISKEHAVDLYNKMEAFSAYGFNESHAVAYTYVSYIQLYLKCYYLKYWIAAAIDVYSKDTKPSSKKAFKVLMKSYSDIIQAPSLNNPKDKYTVDTQKDYIYSPLFSLSDLSEAKSISIMEQSPFEGYFDFLVRTKNGIDVKAHNCLVKSGTLDFYMPEKELAQKDALGRYFLTYLTNFFSEGLMTSEEVSYINRIVTLECLGANNEDSVFDVEGLHEVYTKYNFRKFLLFYYSYVFKNLTTEFKTAWTHPEASRVLVEALQDLNLSQDNLSEKLISILPDEYRELEELKNSKKKAKKESAPKTQKSKKKNNDIIIEDALPLFADILGDAQ